jgi:HK97 family phage portal protein
MTLLDRINRAIRRQTPDSKGSRVWRSVFKETGTAASMGAPFFKDYESFLLAPKMVDWVYSAASVRAYSLAKNGYDIVNRKTGEPAADDHPFRVLIREPNEYQTDFEFFEEIEYHLMLTGNVFMAGEEFNSKGQPRALYNLRPSRVKIMPSPETMIRGYLYYPGTAGEPPIPYGREEVIHLKYPNPANDLYGLGVCEAAEKVLNAEVFHRKSIEAFFQNGMQLSGYVTSDQAVDDISWERAKADFKATHGGTGNRYKTAFFDSGLRYVPIQVSPGDTGLSDITQDNRNRILAMFGVPLSKAGQRETSAVKDDSEDRFFYNETILPDLVRLEMKLNRWAASVGWGDVELVFERQKFEDEAAAIAQGAQLWASGLGTLNESRRMAGLADAVNGDVRQVGLSVEEVETDIVQQAIAKGRAGSKASPSLRKARRKFALKARKATIESAASKWTTNVERFFAQQSVRILARMAQNRSPRDISPSDIMDRESEDKELRRVIAPLHRWAVLEAVKTTRALVAKKAPDIEFPNLDKFVSKLGDKIVTVNGTTLQALKDQLAEGIRRGYSMEQIMRGNDQEGFSGFSGVFKDYAEQGGYRSERIIRNETSVAYNRATVETYKELGLERVELADNLDGWSDEEEGDECLERDGQIVSLEEAEQAVADEHIQGTLTLIPFTE